MVERAIGFVGFRSFLEGWWKIIFLGLIVIGLLGLVLGRGNEVDVFGILRELF